MKTAEGVRQIFFTPARKVARGWGLQKPSDFSVSRSYRSRRANRWSRPVRACIRGRMDRQLPDGSIQRTDPRTGRTRIISEADYQRTRLTRERDAELAMQAGAPPIAQGPVRRMPDVQPVSTGQAGDPDRYRGNNREENVRLAKADGQFDAKRTQFNTANAGKQEMDASGNIAPVSRTLPDLAPSQAPAQPARAARTGPIDATPEMLTTPATSPASPGAPRMPEPSGLRNIAVAAGPNISTAPTGLPQGSIGMKRADGSFTVQLAGGESRSFASEQDAVKAFAAPAPVLPALPGKPSAGSATAASPRLPDQAAASAPTAPVPGSDFAPAYTIKGAGQRAGQAAAFLATDQSAANPANFIDTTERYGAAALGAVWDGTWNVPEKGLIRQGVEFVQERNPIVQNVGSAIGDAQAQARKRDAIAAGRIAPDFDARAEAARQRYALPEPEAAAAAVIPYGDPRNPVRDVTPAAPVMPPPVVDQTPRPAATPVNGTAANLKAARRAPVILPELEAEDPIDFPSLRGGRLSKPTARLALA